MEGLLARLRARVLAYLVAAAAVAMAIGLRAALDPVLGANAPLMLLLLAPTLAAMYGGFGPGLFATLLAAPLGTWWFVAPYESLLPPTPTEWVRVILYVSMGALISWVIHARSRALRRLRASEQRYTLAARAAHNAIWDWDLRTGSLSWNDGVDEVFGHAIALVPPTVTWWYDHIHPDDRTRVAAGIHAVIDWRHGESGDGRAWREEYRFQRADGGYATVLDRGYVARDDDGRATRMIGAMTDLTREVEATTRLRDSEAHLAAVYRQTGAALAETDLSGRFVAANDRYCELVGRSREQLFDLHVPDVTHPDDLPANLPLLERLVATGEPFSIVKRYVRPDGSVVWVTNSVSRVQPPGKPARILAVSIDITERKRTEERLQASETRFRAVFERALVGVALVSFERATFVEVNDALCGMLGYTREELLRTPWPRITHPDDLDGDLVPFRRMAAGELESYTVEKRFLHRAGRHVWARLSLSLVRDAAGRPDYEIAVIEDVTELKHQQRALVDADRRKDEFIATLAHELRNPLAPLRNALAVLDRSADPALVQRARTMMDRQLTHLVRLVDDLLDVSRVATGKLKLDRARIEVQQVVDAALETARAHVEARRHTLVVEPAGGEIWLDGDAVRLAQVLTNLLNNAAKYSEPGGTITVRVTRPRPDLACIAVADTGIGIPEHAQRRVFDLFTQVEQEGGRSQGGLGIGLSLARRLVEMHGGTLTVQSEGVGRGSTFHVGLPVAMRSPGARGAERADGARESKPRRLVVADDNRDAADSLAMTLRLAGHDVAIAYDGREALETLAARRPDAAVLDIGMPEYDGYAVARAVRAQPWGEAVLLVALTGWGQAEDRRRAAEAGFDHHFTKPVDPERLDAVLAGATRNAPSESLRGAPT